MRFSICDWYAIGNRSLTRALVGAGSSRPTAGGETPPLLVHGFYGVGGLGKTALALELAYRLRHHFDGGVLWADLPTTRPEQTLADWAREYGADLSRIEETHARADALRNILRGKRVLAILDGAVDEADDAKIAPLLRALADCASIISLGGTHAIQTLLSPDGL